MRNTIKKVIIVVPVLITSCQVSLNRNNGPVTNQTRITLTARVKVTGLPVTRAVVLARRVNRDRDLVGRITLLHSCQATLPAPASLGTLGQPVRRRTEVPERIPRQRCLARSCA